MALKKINFSDKDLSLFQDNVDASLIPLQKSPFVGGVLLQNVALVSGTNAIQHTLGRTPKVWTVCDTNAAQTVYRTTWNTTYINLTASGSVIISMWLN